MKWEPCKMKLGWHKCAPTTYPLPEPTRGSHVFAYSQGRQKTNCHTSILTFIFIPFYPLKQFVFFVYHFIKKNNIRLGFVVVFLTLHIK